jgi:dTDP-glucose 4,6-dehydratase
VSRVVLVTGGAGFIGVNFVYYWLRAHPADRVVVLDALTYAGNINSLTAARSNPQCQFIHGDICDAELVARLFAEHQPTLITHFAAESHVDRSITGPDEFIRTNVIGTHTLLKAALHHWRRDGQMRADVRFHHVSTDEVYGSLTPTAPAFTESTPFAPNSPYSASKAAADHLVRAYHHTYGLPVTTSNCSNNYGPFHFPEKLIPLMLVRALDGQTLPIYGRGENIRDWLYVEDHCRAIDLIVQRGKLGETYNIGGNNEWRNIDIVDLLCRELDQRFKASPQLTTRFPGCPAAKGLPVATLKQFVTDRPGHDFRYAIDATKARDLLEFQPHETFATGIAKTIDWYLANEPWWRDIQRGSQNSQQKK